MYIDSCKYCKYYPNIQEYQVIYTFIYSVIAYWVCDLSSQWGGQAGLLTKWPDRSVQQYGVSRYSNTYIYINVASKHIGVPRC